MKVIDNIAFCYDYDILEIRLSILYDCVDKFVILECDHTYSNLYKGYNFEKHRDRYAKWMDKIEYIKVKGPGFSDAWTNEHWQWEQLKLGWTDVQPEDLVLLCRCADEIPRPEAIELMKNTDYTFYNLLFPAFFMKLNYMDTNREHAHHSHYFAWLFYNGNVIATNFKIDKFEICHTCANFSNRFKTISLLIVYTD